MREKINYKRIDTFEVTEKEHYLFPFEANLKLHEWDLANDRVLLSHYGSPKKFWMPRKIGIIRSQVPRRELYLSFGYLFPRV